MIIEADRQSEQTLQIHVLVSPSRYPYTHAGIPNVRCNLMASSLDFAVAQVLLPRVVGRVGTVEDAQKASTARAAKYEAAARMKLPLLQRVDPLGSLSLTNAFLAIVTCVFTITIRPDNVWITRTLRQSPSPSSTQHQCRKRQDHLGGQVSHKRRLTCSFGSVESVLVGRT